MPSAQGWGHPFLRKSNRMLRTPPSQLNLNCSNPGPPASIFLMTINPVPPMVLEDNDVKHSRTMGLRGLRMRLCGGQDRAGHSLCAPRTGAAARRALAPSSSSPLAVSDDEPEV